MEEEEEEEEEMMDGLSGWSRPSLDYWLSTFRVRSTHRGGGTGRILALRYEAHWDSCSSSHNFQIHRLKLIRSWVTLEAVRGFYTLTDTRFPPATILDITNNNKNNNQRRGLQVGSGSWICSLWVWLPLLVKLSGQLPAVLIPVPVPVSAASPEYTSGAVTNHEFLECTTIAVCE
ncbi:hypothetical protein ASPBRDRAFT_65422 [Aspergillus brasiliensis CBS 101740]|uniref:Uncharacterized protein n=1 Tax=Aspergillus brasiliensis (strain CBS 101740 / IMI 381727 / IBT 21946) TaxID=767769 RepID=A0A1L9UIW6_ASPBC|nr:hypothetical protein ASPBRDRAFT_65422 [Aspergillus brasiliensis CBS 101740]